ncbi:putative cyclase [Coniophora puteana RWD-64-598 SS2]|uniref:Putative cyclase n=1 Tax=Coniophora puteana (strain RWD-64-598) TaxID=741705 RepID=A0A5M3MLW4_CONPW|nr:putative cyclase [Coniophora puteana RWD-64-598 SS2]EIW80222.1 putative cyclase [Coniophora puteana RWD-64-598 SS2]
MIVDLTHTLSTTGPMSAWPGHPTYSAVQTCCIPPDPSNVHAISLGTHTGTHIDAPFHFVPHGAKVAELDLALLVARAVVVDVRGKEPCGAISWGDLERWEAQITEGVVVIFCTGWSRYWGQPDYANHPYVEVEVAEKLVARGVRVIGSDTFSPDQHQNDRAPDEVHRVILGNGGVIAENLCNLEQALDLEAPTISLLPLKLDAGDGAPVRAVVWSP